MAFYRTTKTSQKLTLFPADVPESELVVPSIDEENILPHHQHHSSYPATLPHVAAKAPKEDFLRRVDKTTLPRATAYCTAK
jgi:uncharacterized Rmd1/YagE family protein